MLTEAAENFQRMFNGSFMEALNIYSDFPEDDLDT